MIWRLFKTFEFWILNWLVFLKMHYLGSRVPLNIPHFRDFAATVKFYTHPNDILGIFSCHNNNSDLCHFLGQAKWHVTGLGSQTSNISDIKPIGLATRQEFPVIQF